MKRLLPALILPVLIGLLAAGCGGTSGPKSVPAGSVAIVGANQITKAELNQLTDEVRASYTAQKKTFPKKGTTAYTTLRDQLVQYLVQVQEFQQKGNDLGVQVTDKDVDQRLTQVKKQYFGGSDKRYQQALKQQGLTDQAYRQSLRAQLISEKLFNKVTSDVKVSDAEIRKYYNSQGQYERRTVRHILVNSKTLADKLYGELQHGADFAALAKKYSKDPGSASKGGKLAISRGQTVPAFDKTAFSLKTGQTSKPVHTQYGWHIIEAVTAVQKTPLSKVKETIRQQLLQQKRNDEMTKFVNDLSKSYCDGKIAYQAGYAPASDPCVSLTTSVSTSAAGTSG